MSGPGSWVDYSTVFAVVLALVFAMLVARVALQVKMKGAEAASICRHGVRVQGGGTAVGGMTDALAVAVSVVIVLVPWTSTVVLCMT